MDSVRRFLLLVSVVLLATCVVAPSPPPQGPPPVQGGQSLAGPVPAAGAKCISWRQTGGCSGTGDREPGNDKSCDAVISEGWSGFCECEGGMLPVDCNHPINNCRNVCRQAAWSELPPPTPMPGSACRSWRQTGGCAATADREPGNDKACNVTIESGWSGYCECANGGVVGVDCGHAELNCAAACNAGSWSALKYR